MQSQVTTKPYDGSSEMLIHGLAPLRKRNGAEGIRTPDLLNAIETRFQLRYSPEQVKIIPYSRIICKLRNRQNAEIQRLTLSSQNNKIGFREGEVFPICNIRAVKASKLTAITRKPQSILHGVTFQLVSDIAPPIYICSMTVFSLGDDILKTIRMSSIHGMILFRLTMTNT